MISFLSGLLKGLLSVLNSFLPESPVTSWVNSLDTVQLALGWLNWIVPVADLVAIFVAFIGLLLGWVAVRMLLSKAFGSVGKVIS